MSASNIDAMVKEAIRLLKSGNKAEARVLLERATEMDGYHEQAWLWLSGVVDTDEEQRICLKNVLFINPSNQHAMQGLAMLDAKLGADVPEEVIVPPEESPFAEFGLPQGDSMLDELERIRLESNTQEMSSVLPFTANDFDNLEDGAFAEPDFDDPFPTTPFQVSSVGLEASPTEKKRLPLEEDLERVLRNPSPVEEGGKRSTREQARTPQPELTGAAALLRAIPKEIVPTRMPGTDAPTPRIYVLLVVVLLLANIGMGIVTFGKILAPMG
jgi:hypothetical protein